LVPGAAFAPPCDEGRNCGDRDDARWQEWLVKEGVEEGAFTLAENCELKTLLPKPLAQIVDASDY
jgi:hypothetical protein